MQIVEQATGLSTSELIKPIMDETLPAPEKRRMLLLRSLPQAAGQANVMTWLLRLDPCPLELNAVRWLPCVFESAFACGHDEAPASTARSPAAA